MRLIRIPVQLTLGIALFSSITLGRPPAAAARPDGKAIAQMSRELRRPAVVAYISLQPGYEDPARLAALRFDEGVQLVVGYVTNGEGTPSDSGDRSPNLVAGRRKEEASRACDLAGATPVFLNLPDPGVIPDRDRLSAIWSRDTLALRLVRLISRYKPDLIIVGSDHRGSEPRSFRAVTLAEAVVDAAGRATALPDTGQMRPWAVARIVAEAGPEPRMRRISKAASGLAKEIAGAYESMRLQIPLSPSVPEQRLETLLPEKGPVPASALDGLPVLGTAGRSFAPMIASLAGTSRKPIDRPSLRAVRRAIDTLDVILARDRALLQPSDVRVLATWKNGLEQLRCLLMGVRVEYSVDDLHVSRSSLSYVKFGEVGPDGDSASTRIFFPLARDHQWGINESLESQFPLSAGREFRVITPYNLEYNYPSSSYGLDRTSLATKFSFIVIHRGKTSDGDYILRKEIPFRATPRRALDVVTPVIRADSAQRLIVRTINANRDAYSGVLSVTDSLFLPVSAKLDLRLRNEIRFDTLLVTPAVDLGEGDYRLTLSVSGGNSYPFVARRFDAVVAPEARIGLITAVEGSPIAAGLERLKAQWTTLSPARPEPTSLNQFNVIVIDRDALSGVRDLGAWGRALRSWVRSGGHLVMLAPTRGGGLPEGIAPLAFTQNPGISPWARLEIDSASTMAASTNRVRPGDWGGWVIARALSHVTFGPAAEARTLVRSEADGLVLAADANDAKGTWTFVSLDLSSQLMNVHPGVHRILANLLRPADGASKP
jgi:LmbE family N-acetylglucosaminyl deacetylase